MKILKLTLLLLIIISCKQKREEVKPELIIEKQITETITEESEMKKEMDFIYEIYKKGKVENFDWDLVFNKADKYRMVSDTYSDKKSIPNDFLEFSNQFISDFEFQKSHIDFEDLLAVIGACEETYVLKENNWVFDDWNFINEIGVDEKWSNTFYYSDSVFFCEFLLNEVGTIRQLGFEKINNKWNLTLYFIDEC